MREGRPSITALKVAFMVLVLGNTGCFLLPPGIIPAQIALLQAAELRGLQKCVFSLLTSPIGIFPSHIARWLANGVCENGMECIGFRKSYIENAVRDFLASKTTASNKRQVLVLGAGYDTLSLRLCQEYQDVNFFEVDHPATGKFKDKLWERKTSEDASTMFTLKPTNIFQAKADLLEKGSLAIALLSTRDIPYDPSIPTIVIMEGLVMYFTESQMHDIFGEFSKLIGPGSVTAFDMIASKQKKDRRVPDIGFATFWLKLYVRLIGEPLFMGLDTINLQGFVSKTNSWRIESNVNSFGPARLATLRLSRKMD